MNRSNKFLSILFYAFAIAILSIISIYLSSEIMISIKNDSAKLIYNAPIAAILMILLFFIWEFFLKKSDPSLFLEDINCLIYSFFSSLIIVSLLVLFVINRSQSFDMLKWRILEYLFILIPVYSILVLIKFYKGKK